MLTESAVEMISQYLINKQAKNEEKLAIALTLIRACDGRMYEVQEWLYKAEQEGRNNV